MRPRALVLCSLLVACASPAANNPDLSRWEATAARVTITRDDWGIAHIKGPTDADAIFGMMYAQAEDDFNRIEVNYLNSMGRLAEAEGEKEIWRDLRMKLFIDPADMQKQYAAAPESLRKLMDAWADGLNYYLHTHPEVKPRVITRFEPWMPLSFSEGSIGGDIERVSLQELEAFYGDTAKRQVAVIEHDPDLEPRGSNGIAIGGSMTQSGKAMLLINPHTSFFFRSEAQVTSDEGLNAYGASTWGQFFVYQGFNEKAGWMHTSSGADNIDEYAESVSTKDSGYVYRYGTEERAVTSQEIVLPYKTETGMAQRKVRVFRTHHGPVVRAVDGKWISVRLMQEPLKALQQSYNRTRATNLKEFRETMELHTNSSNNTLFADAEGNFAYFHANFVPKRDLKFNWRQPVDGTTPATEWNGVHGIDESPNVFNPAIGWVYNTNNWPYSAAGPQSPRRKDYPSYMDLNLENPRGLHAIRVLSGRKNFTLDSLIAAAYDSYLPAFESLIPTLLQAWDQAPASDTLKGQLAEPVAALREWDYRWSATSVPTSLAVYWGEELWRAVRADAESEDMSIYDFMAKRASPQVRLAAFAAAVGQLTADFGNWKTPWGDINRFQRLTADIVHPFDDAGASIPVAFTSSRWGSLASFGARTFKTKKLYGTSGNSFVAVVEFGDSVRARAVTAGGESGNPASKHFNDQAERYATGKLRDVYFYPSQLTGHTERTYQPGK